MTAASVNPLYESALNQAKKFPATANSIAKVAKATSEEAARWAFSQWALRDRAKTKFARAGEMLFDRDGLEMATHEAVAAYHASLFPEGKLVADLTVGIGADLIALARRGPAIGFEIDLDRVEVARHNLRVHEVEADVSAADYRSDAYALGSRSGDRRSIQNYFADPARRAGNRRTINPEEFLPNPLEILEHFPDAKLGIIKLSPMLPDEFLESFGGNLRFLSFGGECREALVLVGTEAGEGREAVQVETGECLSASDEFIEAVDEPGAFLYEADPAAIRAHALGTLCEQFGLRFLGDSNGYLTGSSAVESPWLKGFRVLGSGRFDLSSLKKMLRDLDSSTPVLKQRLTNQDLQKLQKQLAMPGARELSVALYPVGKSIRQVILEPLR